MPTESFNISMDSELKKELKKIAIDENTTPSAIITKLVLEYIQKKKREKI